MIKEMHDFIAVKVLDENKSELTGNNYGRWLEEFCTILNVTSLEQFLSLTKDDLQNYIRVLNEKNQSSSVWTKAIALKSFYSYLIEEEICKKNLMAKVRLPKRTKKEKALPPTKEDIMDMLEEIRKNKTYYVLLTVLASTGIRISEALALKTTSFTGNQVKICGKGDKERTVFLSDDVMKIINDYIENDRHEKPILSKEEFEAKNWTKYKSYETYANGLIQAKDLLFLSKNGKVMDVPSINKTFEKYASKAGIDMSLVHCNPHKMRSFYITYGLNNGVSTSAMQSLVGHADPSTTYSYVGLNQDERREASQRAFNFGKALNGK